MGGQQAAAGTPFTPAADGAAFTRKLATGGPCGPTREAAL